MFSYGRVACFVFFFLFIGAVTGFHTGEQLPFPGDELAPSTSTGGTSPVSPSINTTVSNPSSEDLPPSPPPIYEESTVLSPASSPAVAPVNAPTSVRDAEEQSPASLSSLPSWAPLVAFTVAIVFILQTVLLMVVTMKVFHHDTTPVVPRPLSIPRSAPAEQERVEPGPLYVKHPQTASTLPPRPAVTTVPDATVVETMRGYVASCRAQGFPDARIRSQLQQSGRLPAEIDMAMTR